MMERLRRERNGLRDELASSSAARDDALAQVEAVQLKLGKAISSEGGGAALAEAQRKVQALTEAVESVRAARLQLRRGDRSYSRTRPPSSGAFEEARV